MKIINVVGARPNFMKVAPLMAEYTKHRNIDPLLVHTGQHYDEKMSGLFFKELGIPEPDINLEVGSASHAVQTAEIMKAFEPIVIEHKPDAVLVVGDVNSTIACGLVAVKLGVKLIHVEAGLRSGDRSMPEEINRILTDSISDLLFCTEQCGVTNLLKEGVPQDRIYLVGHVMVDTLLNHLEKAKASTILEELRAQGCFLTAAQYEERAQEGQKRSREGRDSDRTATLELRTTYTNGDRYVLLTLHRPSNVDDPKTFSRILDALEIIQRDGPVLFPIHPRARKNLAVFGLQDRLDTFQNVHLLEPLGYLDFLKLNSCAKVVLTDSGGIQEETTALKVPCITLRETTERPITVEIGSNQIAGTNPEKIVAAYRHVMSGQWRETQIPPLWDGKAAERIVRIMQERLESA